jgi:uncharacterized protein YegL
VTDPNYVHYVLVIDRSGSMTSIRADAEGGIHSFVEDQAKTTAGKDGKVTLSLYQFDSTVDRVLDFSPLSHGLLYKLVPSGMTRLLDAVGTAVTETGEKLAAMDESERPGKVVVLIVTDGEENASYEWEANAVNRLVTEQTEKYSWAFSYIGANQDAWATGASLGIDMASSLNYTATPEGTRGAYQKMSRSVDDYISGRAVSILYDDDDPE